MARSPLIVSCLTAAVALGFTAARHTPPVDTTIAVPNDNRRPAGTLRDGVLTISLEVRSALWYPEGDNGPSLEVATFAEVDGLAQIPGPLLRVPAGTVIHATISNALPDSSVTVHGFVTRPAATADTIRLAPRQSRSVRFTAGAPGTYFYWAEVGAYTPEALVPGLPRRHEREQLAGAFIVDEPGAPRPDRVFVINIWGDRVDSVSIRGALAINGQSWPHTERLAATTGDSVRWRVINASLRGHPMHLHGFYYQVTAAGDALAARAVPDGQRPLVVTHELRGRQTMDVAWNASRPGNWLFHCHLAFHVIPEARLDPTPQHYSHSVDAAEHMAGLILGVNVTSRGGAEPAATATRHLRLLVQEGPRRSRALRSLGFVLQRDSHEPRADSIEIPGSPLVLTRGQPTTITVVNKLKEPTAVHWHGIELESFSDGVPGWSGDATRQAPLIAPRDSFTANLTLHRAGTFMYHTHLNDVEQLTSGLYGPIIVLEPGQQWSRDTDHVVVLSWDGDYRPAPIVFEGDSAPPPLRLAAGRTHRLRLISIGAAAVVNLTLRRDTTLMEWRPLAKDGADLPVALQKPGPARQPLTVGETYDVAFTPPGPGDYELRATFPAGRVSRRVIVQ